MKKIDLIMQCIENELCLDSFLKRIEARENPGITANFIQDKLGIIRNNASTLLNQLWKEHKLIKINTRPVSFIPVSLILNSAANKSPKDTYTLEELYQLVNYVETKESVDPFAKLLGNNNSLMNQIGQAKAAIVYPPKGLHTLILGESGVGKTTFACAMHEYGMQIRQKTKEEYPFVTFNCADYFNNPQLLLSQLFGHAKNAFTGADKDKVGLVEKANGGILFLDEIHRLPPDGQEMLFYLIDKGEYNRLGEIGIRRSSNVLIIAATTEDPSDTLLATFIRRIPVNITLPSFHEKPIGERVEIVDHFFYCEALNLNRKIMIAPEVLKSLAIFEFRIGNIGQLRSEVKLLCAKAFLQHLQNQKEIIIDFQMLNREIREVLFDYAKLDNNIKNYLNMFSEDIVIFPVKERESFTFDLKNNIYEVILKKLDSLKKQGIDQELIHAELSDEVENHFKQVMDKFNNTRTNIQNLYKIVPKETVDTATLLIELAQDQLKTKLNNKFIFGLSFHLQALFKRIEEQKIIFNPHLQSIKESHPKEYQAAELLVNQLSTSFAMKIPEDEKGFLTLLLVHNKVESPQDEKIGLIIVCHGDSTASSIANVVNALLNTEWVKAIDMPLSTTISETYQKVRTAAIAVNRGKGVLLLVDMGSLLTFAEKLRNDAGIYSRVIDYVSTPLALEALRNILYKLDDIDTLYTTLTQKINHTFEPATDTKQPAILSVCATGEGSSKMAKSILETLLEENHLATIPILVTNTTEVKNKMLEYTKAYNILAIVGNANPNLGIPYFPIHQLLEPTFQKKFIQVLSGGIEIAQTTLIPPKSIYDKSQALLEQYVKYINPKFAIKHIKKFLEQINYTTKNDNDAIDFIVHMGCMLDRCRHNYFVQFDDRDTFIKTHKKEFDKVRFAVNLLAKEYQVTINDDEVCYILKILWR
ncbi:sigma 54-interacting transcriptional regulator [Anaerosinus gibii]|uniref:Sigma 54-interacting transcriptional regulator n=1 Tax=Selenobaculum gibii TaxID=3054208 RepID=A0A9Y2ES03_9FIRM|nr:sigma-54-dependent transcriptional regulator [Selenobaculum gbiensis]WIW70338.1 sigma 54-interacting transcriptional regulator [Selenobaculum gbiensis]